MFSWITRFFPVKTKSPEEFVRLVKNYHCTSLSAEAANSGDTVMTSPVGGIGTFAYKVVYTATEGERKVILEQPCGERFGSTHGIADARERGNAAIVALLTADAGLQTLKERLPQLVSAFLISPRGIMDEGELQSLRSDASHNGLRPYPLLQD